MSGNYTGIGARKSHRKSKRGCGTCKRRHIKCDETLPTCSNCARHSVICDFTTGHSSPASVATPAQARLVPASSVSSEGNGENAEWGLTSLKLLQNYSTSTCYTLSDMPTLQTFWRTVVPEVGFSHPFVLQGILALSALHLAHFNPSLGAFYQAEADHRYYQGLRTATHLLSQIDSENCHAIYLFANTCCVYTLARGPQSGDFLLFGDQGIAEWLSLFRGLRPIISLHLETLRSGVLAPLFKIGKAASAAQSTDNPEIEQMGEIRDLISTTAKEQDASQALLDALSALSPLFSARYNVNGDKKPFHINSLGPWLYRASDEFVTLLQQHHPAALVIMAYFCVLLNDVSTSWMLQGWVTHTMQGIYDYLGNEHRLSIRWPTEQIGWIPK